MMFKIILTIISRKRKILIAFDHMIADINTNKKFQTIVKELFIRCRKLNVSPVFIKKPYFSVPKDVRLNSTYYLMMNIYNEIELQRIAMNHSADMDYKNLHLYRRCTSKQYSFLTIDTILPTDDPLGCRQNLYKMIINSL